MAYNVRRESVDGLIKNFWKYGFLTVSRKYGTYLPEPSPVGNYDIEAIGKNRRKYVIGITLAEEDIDNPNILKKISFLASRNTRYSKTKVKLFIGIKKHLMNKAKLLISRLNDNQRKSIRLVPTD